MSFIMACRKKLRRQRQYDIVRLEPLLSGINAKIDVNRPAGTIKRLAPLQIGTVHHLPERNQHPGVASGTLS